MTDITLNYYLIVGPDADRLAHTPDPAVVGPGSGIAVLWTVDDDPDFPQYVWDFGGPGWELVGGGGAGGITELTGDVTAGPGSGSQAATIANNAVTTGKILNSAVTLAKIANQADLTVLGNNSGGAGPPIALTAAQTRTVLGLATVATSGSAADLSTGTLPAPRMPALTGDVTSTAGAVATVLATPLTPGGRLTVTSNTPVLNADATAQGTVYYAPYVHARLPLYTGSVWAMRAFSQLTLTLNSTDNTSTNLYDIFVVDVGGTLTLGTGPAWTNSTTRADAIALLNGIWTNNASIALRANGSALTGSPFAANIATYLGTIYCTANGQTGMAFTPAATGGGTNNFLAIYNAYNQVPVIATCRDGTTSWTRVASATIVAMNVGGTGSGLNNRISYVDGLGQSSVSAVFQQSCGGGAGDAYPGMARDSTTVFDFAAQHTGAGVLTATIPGVWKPSLGLHYVQELVATASATMTFYGAVTTPTRQLNALTLQLMM
jgi:hypothetical protein